MTPPRLHSPGAAKTRLVAIDRMKRPQRFRGRPPQGGLRRIALGDRPFCIGARMSLGRLTMLVICGKDGLPYQRFVDRH